MQIPAVFYTSPSSSNLVSCHGIYWKIQKLESIKNIVSLFLSRWHFPFDKINEKKTHTYLASKGVSERMNISAVMSSLKCNFLCQLPHFCHDYEKYYYRSVLVGNRHKKLFSLFFFKCTFFYSISKLSFHNNYTISSEISIVWPMIIKRWRTHANWMLSVPRIRQLITSYRIYFHFAQNTHREAVQTVACRVVRCAVLIEIDCAIDFNEVWQFSLLKIIWRVFCEREKKNENNKCKVLILRKAFDWNRRTATNKKQRRRRRFNSKFADSLHLQLFARRFGISRCLKNGLSFDRLERHTQTHITHREVQTDTLANFFVSVCVYV